MSLWARRWLWWPRPAPASICDVPRRDRAKRSFRRRPRRHRVPPKPPIHLRPRRRLRQSLRLLLLQSFPTRPQRRHPSIRPVRNSQRPSRRDPRQRKRIAHRHRERRVSTRARKTAAAAVGKPAANTIVPAQETPAPPFAQSDNRSQQPTTKEPDELARLEQEVDQLEVRALTVNGTVQRLQQEQARQGVGLRGDMASWHAAMNLNLSKAAEALAQRDATRAQRYRKLAQDNLEALEKALGR